MKNRETVREVKSIKVIKEIIDQVDEEYKEEVTEFYSTKGKENKYQNINKFCKKVKLTEQSCNERSKPYENSGSVIDSVFNNYEKYSQNIKREKDMRRAQIL